MQSIKIRDYLKDNITCVVATHDGILTSEKRGIDPVLEWINSGIDLTGASVADKIVGKAVAMLFVMAGIKEVYAEVLSVSGKAFLEQNNINVSWGVLTDVIINRQGTGMCPMEKAVLNINDCREAFKVLMH